MYINFNSKDKIFSLKTKNTEYSFSIVSDRYLMHNYYGKILNYTPMPIKMPSSGFSIDAVKYDRNFEIDSNNNWEYELFTLTDDLLEFSYFDSGDYRPSSLKIKNQYGNCSTFFTYISHKIYKGRKNIPNLPFARETDDCETLAIELYDETSKCYLTLYYTVYPSNDIITRYFSLKNSGNDSIKIQKAMSICLDLPGHDYDMLTLYGRHYFERNLQSTPLFYGNQKIMSRRGASSHHFNPFIALASKNTTETNGNVFAFNFIFSGCFLDEVEVDSHGNTRVGIGLGEENFSYKLSPNDTFFSPEAIMTFTSNGLGEMSRIMHRFIRETITPVEKAPKRPVVLNSWEAVSFDINQDLLINFARESAKYGIDTIVMDDGWFGDRNNDKAGLGDWYPNPKKFPNGLTDFQKKINEAGVKLGIWIEPEMVNPDSNLFREHPEWCLQCTNRESSLSRNQLVLDLTNPEVINYLKNSFSLLFDKLNIDYLKWDCNRNLSQVGSTYLPKDQQEETYYRYQLGVYELLEWFNKKYPNMLIETCSGGGGRYDLGMMAYSSQIWTSDNTYPECRTRIQYATSLAYPSSVMSCHVTKLKNTSDFLDDLEYKFIVATGGILGYEFNILEVNDEIKKELPKQIEIYRKAEDLIKYGDLYRLLSPYESIDGASAYYYADPNQPDSKFFLSFIQTSAPLYPNTYILKISIANSEKKYKDFISGKIYDGKELQNGIFIETSVQRNARLYLFEEI